MPPTKRFIAGAVCPACGTEDTIRALIGQNGLQQRECVRCGFSDRMQGGEKEMPRSRLQRADPAVTGEEPAVEKPVRFYPRVAGKRKQE